MLIGIKLTKAKSGPPQPSIFYCGLNAAELRAEHAKLLASNEDGSRFYQCHNPLMIPLPSVPENTEDHPDHVHHQKRRAELAKNIEAAAPTVIRIPVTERSPEVENPIIPIPGTETGSTDKSEVAVATTPEARRAELSVLKHADLRAIAQGIKTSGRPIALMTGTKAQIIEAILASEISTSGSEEPPAA